MQIWPWLPIAVCLTVPVPLFAEQPGIPDPQWDVARAQFTTGIENREPVDRVVVATPMIRDMYFFTDLRNLAGRVVTHRWKYQGNVVSQVPFKVGGPRWRVYSRKEIEPDEVGEWSVTVVDESGWPLYTELFRFENGAPLVQPTEHAAPEDDGSTDSDQDSPVLQEASPPAAVTDISQQSQGAASSP